MATTSNKTDAIIIRFDRDNNTHTTASYILHNILDKYNVVYTEKKYLYKDMKTGIEKDLREYTISINANKLYEVSNKIWFLISVYYIDFSPICSISGDLDLSIVLDKKQFFDFNVIYDYKGE